MRRMRQLPGAVLLLIMLSLCFPPATRAADQEATRIADGLDLLSTTLSLAGTADQLGQTLPLMLSSPGGAHGLRLNTIFAESLQTRLRAGYPYLDLEDLRTAIDSVDGTYGGVTVSFEVLRLARSLANPALIELSLTARATRSVIIPLDYDDGVVRLSGGGVSLDLALETTLNLELDTELVDGEQDHQAFALIGEPALDIHIDSHRAQGQRASIGTLQAELGFTSVTVEGGLDLDLDLRLSLRDPDGNGRLTAYELRSASVADLAQVEIVDDPATTAVDALLTLDSSLVDGAPDGIVSLRDDSLADGLAAPDVDLANLLDFSRVNVEDVLNGLGQFATGLLASQGSSNIQLPFLKDGLASAFAVAQPLVSFLKRQGEAAINCGTFNTSPPVGDTSHAPAGSTIYCQAIALQNPLDVSWHIAEEDGAPGFGTSGPEALTTVGVQPNATAQFKLKAGGNPRVEVSFTDPDGTQHTVRKRFLAAQDMLTQLAELAGFTDPDNAIYYRPETHSLYVHLVTTFDTQPVSGTIDIGDQLQAAHLAGLSTRGGASAIIDPQEIKLDATFGIILAGDEISPGLTLADRFFIQPGSNSNQTIFQADLPVTATLDLQGRIGFLDVMARGDASQNLQQPGTAFQIGRHDPAQPMLRVSLDAPGFQIGSGPTAITIPGAIQLSTLLQDPLDLIDLHCNMDLSAGLMVEASLGASVSASGGVSVSWPDLFGDGCLPDPGRLVVDGSADFDQQLIGFDVSPVALGQHTGAASPALLVDSSRDFSLVENVVGATFNNLTDGSSCSVSELVDAHTLRCELSGGSDQTWQPDDRYAGAGDPLAMLNMILEGLFRLADSIDRISGESALGQALDAPLPLVNLNPRQLLGGLNQLRGTISDIRNGGAGSVICGAGDAAPPTGAIETVAGGTTIYCQLQTAGAVQDVRWSATGGTPGARTGRSDPRTGDTAGPTPSASAELTIGGQPGESRRLGQDFRVLVEYVDSSGAHSAEYPKVELSSLQKLEQLIEAKLGLDPVAFGFELRDLPPSGASDGQGDGVQDLVVRLGYAVCTLDNSVIGACQETDRTAEKLRQPLQLALGGAGSLASLQGDASVEVEYAARARLDIAIPLKPQLDLGAIAVVDTSGVELEAGVRSDQLSLQATLGPLKLSVGADGAPGHAGKIRLGAGLSLAHKDRDAQPNNQTFALLDFLANLELRFNRPAQIGDCGLTDADDDPATPAEPLTGDACAKLSILVGESHLGDLDFRIADLTQAPDALDSLDGWYAHLPADLADRLAGALLDWTLLLETIRQLSADLAYQMDGAAQHQQIPLIGTALDGGADVAQAVSDLAGSLKDLATQIKATGDVDLDGDVDVVDVPPLIRQKIFEAVGPGSSLPLLQDRDGDDQVTLDDIGVRLLCAEAAATPSAEACADHTPLDQIADARLTIKIGTALVDQQLPFAIGLDGLPLRAAASVQANVGWSLLLDFGINRSEGPYLVPGAPGSDPELSLSASVRLGQTIDPDCNRSMPDLSGALDNFNTQRCFIGELGFLQVVMQDGADGSDATPTPDDDRTVSMVRLGLDLRARAPGDARLSLNDLLGGAADLQPAFEVSSRINLRFRTGFTDATNDLPSLLGSFHFSWAMDANGVHEPQVQFKHLHLDAGEFISRFLSPIVGTIKKVTGPLQPAIDTVMAPMPVLSDLSRMMGGGDISLYSLLELRVGADKLKLLKSILGLISFVNNMPSDPGALLIPLDGSAGGWFSLDPAKLLAGPTPAGRADDLIQSQSPTPSMLGALGGAPAAGKEGAFGVPGLSFPAFEKPASLFSLLLGKDITLVRYEPGQLSASLSWSYTFGPIPIGPVPLSVGMGLSVSVEGHFAIGYDTSGLRAVIERGETADRLLNGIFIDDYDANGQEVPELRLRGRVSASASVDFYLVAAGIEGGIEISINVDLHDPNTDGKLRVDELLKGLIDPGCLFDFSGRIDAFLEAFLRLGPSWFSATARWEILRVRLLDFTINFCTPRPATLASLDASGNLLLKVGPNASGRGIGEGQRDEEVKVRQLDPGGTRFSVAAFGAYQELTIAAGKQIVAFGGDGNDTFSFEAGVAGDGAAIPFTARLQIDGGTGNDRINGGEGNDTLTGGEGNDRLSGGGGNDRLSGGEGANTLNGDAGDDTLTGGEGADMLNGGPGADRLEGLAGDDLLNGGPGAAQGALADLADTLIGGLGADKLDGGEAADRLYGDAAVDDPAASGAGGDDTLSGGAGDDLLNGGPGADTLNGQLDNDTLFGAAGNDRLEGDPEASPAGRDSLHGGPDQDILSGGGGNDTLNGDAGQDTLAGQAGDDLLSGGPDGDIVSGDDGNDALNGDDGNDALNGGAGNDTLRGAAGQDTLGGDLGDDALMGGLAEDTLRGGDGADTLNGDEGADLLYGESGADTLYGDADADTLHGGPGADLLEGDDGVDTLFGDGDNDTLHGGPGDDAIHGNLGDDLLGGDEGADTLFGDEDQDTLHGDDGADILYGSQGDDVLDGGSGADLLAGDDGADTLRGAADDDLLHGDLGNDTLDGGEGADTLHGDDGLDALHGGAGADLLFGGMGADTLAGNDGADILAGDDGADILTGDDGADALLGNEGPDTLGGGPGDDLLSGGEGADTLHGDDGADTLHGNLGPDTLNGGADNDLVHGDEDADTLHGDDGDDALFGDEDQDTLHGDDGGDTLHGNLGLDTLSGGPGDDALFGDEDQDTLHGGDGDDALHGNQGDDLLFGDIATDTLFGDDGDDQLEGGPGGDTLSGGPGDDDLLGGNTQAGLDDQGDMLHGDDGHDVLLGDNGRISRSLDASGRLLRDPNTDAVLRQVTLYDVQRLGAAPPSASASGSDTIFGDGGSDRIVGQGGNDLLDGGLNDDDIEGNQGADTIRGDAGQDDLIGGSADRGNLFGEMISWLEPADGDDTIDGGADSDVILGDNGDISRPAGPGGLWQRIEGAGHALVVRQTRMAVGLPLSPVYGDDTLLGGAGDDDLYGQLGDDHVEGGAGDDAIVGDLGQITSRLEDGSRQRTLTTNRPGLEEIVYRAGTLSRNVHLYSALDGDDTLLGDDGDDSLHGGGGADSINGDGDGNRTTGADPNPATLDQDRVFGGDGDDALWGGRGHDHLFGGHGDDALDVKPRTATPGHPADPEAWFSYGMPDNYQGQDIIYGGWGQDALQANLTDTRSQLGDRLLDWVGNYNVYYTCGPDSNVAIRNRNPSVQRFLEELAEADGASTPTISGSSGFRELALVFAGQGGQNSHPSHPDHPGHFTCVR